VVELDLAGLALAGDVMTGARSGWRGSERSWILAGVVMGGVRSGWLGSCWCHFEWS
jgi:hypothetical protein